MNYAEIKTCDIANGPGIRTSLFVSGCTHHCKNCFNAETWSFTYGSPFTEETEEEIRQIVAEDSQASEMHHLCTRRLGNRIAIEMHLRFPGEMSLYDAHRHATHIEQRLKQRFGFNTHINIHLEPTKTDGIYKAPTTK